MQFDVNLERDEVYECGALLLTVLGGPKDALTERSVQLYQSLCGHALWARYLEQPNDDLTPIRVKPPYVSRDRKIIDRDVAYISKRFGERMVAARMAIAFLKEAELCQLKPLPKGMKRLSVNQLAAFVQDDAEQAEASKLKSRIWAPSRPVIHLAAAAATIGQKASNSGEPIGQERFLTDRASIALVLQLAEELEALIARDSQFPVRPEQLIYFGWPDWGHFCDRFLTSIGLRESRRLRSTPNHAGHLGKPASRIVSSPVAH